MKNRKFEIPAELLAEFAEMLSERGIENQLDGTTEDNDVIVSIFYDPSEREAVLELMEWYEENVEEED
jgi:hypothetical protein